MGKLTTWAGIVFATAMLLVFALLMMLAGSSGATAVSGTGPGGDLTADSPVPEKYRKLIVEAASACPEVTASLLAAQLHTESGFNPRAQSKDAAGRPIAQGIAQFTPGTWAAHGVDGNGDGKRDVWDPADAIPAAAKYDCTLAAEVKNVPGNSTDTMLAAYNAGSGAVMRYRGIPPYKETRDYIRKIRALAKQWGASDGGLPQLPAGSGGAAQAIAAAKTALGTWYQWGGTCQPPYEGGTGCDCSSLVQMAWGAAGVNLPRTTYDQVHEGKPVARLSQLRPGDLLFSVGSAERPEHVGMYIGSNRVIDAPYTGERVRIKPLSHWTNQIVAMRHIG